MSSARPKINNTDEEKQGKSSTRTIFENFKQGDIVFGLSNPRGVVGSRLTKLGFHHIYANSLNDPAVSLVAGSSKDEEKEQKINTLDKEQKAHYEFLSKHKEYLQKKDGKSVPLMKDSNPVLGSAYRRACKLLLINRNERNYTAHFITKGILWKQVCTKENDNASVTGSELRAAFRDYKKNGPHPHIKYYDHYNRERSTPPWLMHGFQVHWNGYQKKRNEKHRSIKAESQDSDAKRFKTHQPGK